MRNHRPISWRVLVVTMVALPCGRTLGDVLNVPAQYETIQAAIDEAEHGDEVVVAPATYTGDGNRDLDFGGKAITVRSEEGPDATVLDCEWAGRGFYFHSGEGSASVVDGFTITNAHASSNSGAIFCDSGSNPTITGCAIELSMSDRGITCDHASSPTITGCIITGSITGGGDAVVCWGGSAPTISDCVITETDTGISVSSHEASPTITHCTITRSKGVGIYLAGGSGSAPTISDCVITENRGGGISLGSSPTISDCTIADNSTQGDGGGIHCWEGSPTIIDCEITGNTAYAEGGGIYCLSSNLTIIRCTIGANWADDHGGGISCHQSNATITNCAISGNVATDNGAGIYCWESSPSITNCTITDNLAAAFGGGIASRYSNPTMLNCTISGNLAFYGGGILCMGGGGGPTVTNCILRGDSAPEIYVHSGSLALTYNNVQGGWPGDGNIDADPIFVDPDGPDDNPDTWEDNDYRLSPGSPCMDAGSNEELPADVADLDEDGNENERVPLDLDGNYRVMNCAVDMGTYEYQVLDDEAPVLCGALIRKAHGDLGEFDVHLPVVGGTECRAGELTRLNLLLSEPVGAIDGTLDGTEIGLSLGVLEFASIEGPELSLDLSGIPDASCLNVSVTGVMDAESLPLAGGSDVQITVLTGDTNDDGSTNNTDKSWVASLNGHPVLPDNIRFDVNLDGQINNTDKSLVASLNGHGVTCP